jgi:hypothetical protein
MVMKRVMFSVLILLGSVAMAAEDEAALKAQMKQACAALFADGAPCSNLAKGSRNCVRQNLAAGGDACAAFEKANAAFFDAGKNDPIVKK